jgi:hypothetical protein
MRQMLVVGPFPWQAIGVTPSDWKNCEIDEAFGEADAGRLLRNAPTTSSSRRRRRRRRGTRMAIVSDARQQQPGIRTVVIAPS